MQEGVHADQLQSAHCARIGSTLREEVRCGTGRVRTSAISMATSMICAGW
jgi:hypothetical protein